jgi:tRNA(fMet)-specific endonuclease VapC
MVRRYYLLDTNIISEPARPSPSQKVIEKLELYAPVAAVSAITWHELLYGLNLIERKERRTELERYLFNVVSRIYPVVPYDEHAAAVHADLRAANQKKGTPQPMLDSQIAAIAIVNNMILVTRNPADFTGIPGLMYENWFES